MSENDNSQDMPAWASALVAAFAQKQEPEKPKGVAELIPALMLKIGNIGKERKNTFAGYQFRGIDDVLNTVGPAAQSLGMRAEVKTTDYVRTVEDAIEGTKKGFNVHVSLKVIVTFHAPDGSTHTAESYGEGIDKNGDKATNKAMASAFKYANFFGLIIPIDGVLDDGDEEGPAQRPTGAPRTRAGQKLADAAKKPEPEEPVEQVATITRKALSEIGRLKDELKWSDKTMKEKALIVSNQITDNVADFTQDQAAQMIARMGDIITARAEKAAGK